MSKELDELRQEYAENEAKLRQYQNRVKRLEQRRSVYHRPERPPVRSQRGHRRGNGRECRRPHGFIRKLGNTFGDPVR